MQVSITITYSRLAVKRIPRSSKSNIMYRHLSYAHQGFPYMNVYIIYGWCVYKYCYAGNMFEFNFISSRYSHINTTTRNQQITLEDEIALFMYI